MPSAFLTWSRRLLLATTWLIVIVFVALFLGEESGLLGQYLRHRVTEGLGLGASVEIGEVRLRWLKPGISLEEVTLRAPREGPVGGEELLRARAVHISLWPQLSDGHPFRSIHIESPRILISDHLLDGFQRIRQAFPQRDLSPQARDLFELSPPTLYVTDFSVGLELPDRGKVHIGTIDLVAKPDRDGEFQLDGRLFPKLAGAVNGPAAVQVTGRMQSQRIELEARALDIPLATDDFQLPGFLGQVFVEDFHGDLTVDARAVLELRDESVVSGSVRASLSHARLRPAVLDTWLEDVTFDIEASFRPPPGVDLWHKSSWDATARATANCYGSPFTAWGEFGIEVPRDAWFRGFCRAESFEIHRATLENLGVRDNEIWEAFAPRGVIDSSLEFLARPDDTPTGWNRELAVHLRPRAGTGLTFHGFPDKNKELRGFPLAVEEFSGQAWITFDESRPRPWRAAAFDLVGSTSNGEVEGWAQFSAPFQDESADKTEFDLFLSAEKLVIDDVLAEAMQGNPATRHIWSDYSPSRGTLSAEWRLRAGPETEGLTGAGLVQVHEAEVRWAELPVPLENIEGQLSFVWGAKPTPLSGEREAWRSFGVEYEFRNDQSDHTGAKARLSGFAREEPIQTGSRLEDLPKTWVQGLSVEIDELFLRGRNFHILAETFPTLGEQVEKLGAVGQVGVRYYGARAHPDLPFRSDIEAWPEDVDVTPAFFQKRVPNIQGRLCLQTWQQGEQEAQTESVVSFLGEWPGGAELAARGTIPVRGNALIDFYGAGIRPDDSSLRGAFLTAMSEGEEGEPGMAIDLSGQKLFGPIDVAALSVFDPGSPDPPVNSYRVFLRDNVLENDRMTLEGMHGVFTKTDSVFASDLLEGELNGQKVELRNVYLYPIAHSARFEEADPLLKRSGFWTDPDGFCMQADVFIKTMPIASLRPKELPEMEDPPGGFINIPGARIIVTWELVDGGKVALRGPVQAQDIDFGERLPVKIGNAWIDVDEFIFEEGRLRGWGEVLGLTADIAGHELSEARMIVGYVDKRLTVDNLSGVFEGGTLESLGAQGSHGSRKALGVDLAAPHRFDVAVQLKRVHVDKLLHGVFRSSIADEGFLDASLQLSGTPGDVLGMVGRGRINLDEGRLWSIPVIRDLFRTLGSDKAGIFDRLFARFTLRNGVIDISELKVQSTLLNLVGKGFQDLDGRLGYDLEVRYSILDGKSIFHRLLYWFNNSLFRVGVRGDFSRPEITLRNSIMELLGGRFDKHPDRHLPLPNFSDLGERF